MANTTQKLPAKNAVKPSQASHKVRTFFSAVAGTIAVYLILSTLTVVWLNRTLTNTDTFVATVGPIVEKPEIQKYVAETVASQIVANAPAKDLAQRLLPKKEINHASAAQLRTLLKPVVEQSVLKIVQSQQFDTLWQTTIRTSHASLMRQLNSPNPDSISLDLSPAVNGVVKQMKATQLKPIATQIDIKPDTGKLTIKSNKLARIHKYYEWFKDGTIGIILLTIAMIALSVWLSVHHGKTARRILMSTGILALIQSLILLAPSYVSFSGKNITEQEAAKVLAQSLLHNLQVASLVIGVVCIAAAIGSKLYIKFKH